MQVFGSKGWAEVGDVEHLTTWDLKLCYLDPRNILVKQKPMVMKFEPTSTERAELEYFAQAAVAGRGIAMPGGDEVHNVAVLESIMRSASEDSRQRIEA
jgi:predicted dehydrogenase